MGDHDHPEKIRSEVEKIIFYKRRRNSKDTQGTCENAHDVSNTPQLQSFLEMGFDPA